ncbi:MAG: hypothetical protein KBS59_02670, partial [Clostridiales bacterium]|nr:hypothetical protein [Clostridiales bacterium]
MTCTVDGFSAWGKDIGGYSSNPTVAEGTEAKFNHKADGDLGFDWWVNDGELVIEDPKYCASVAFTVGSWIEMLTKYSGK